MKNILSEHGRPGPARGFTLIEILIVVTIIAILATTILPNFIGFDVEARPAPGDPHHEPLIAHRIPVRRTP